MSALRTRDTSAEAKLDAARRTRVARQTQIWAEKHHLGLPAVAPGLSPEERKHLTDQHHRSVDRLEFDAARMSAQILQEEMFFEPLNALMDASESAFVGIYQTLQVIDACARTQPTTQEEYAQEIHSQIPVGSSPEIQRRKTACVKTHHRALNLYWKFNACCHVDRRIQGEQLTESASTGLLRLRDALMQALLETALCYDIALAASPDEGKRLFVEFLNQTATNFED